MTTKNATQMAETYDPKSSVAFNKLMVKCRVLQVALSDYGGVKTTKTYFE